MLREMNIDAKMVFARSRFEDLFVKQAKYWQFDRTLVAVEKRDEKTKYYSPGFPYIPLDETPYSLEGVIALVSDGQEYLTPIPFSEAVKNTISPDKISPARKTVPHITSVPVVENWCSSHATPVTPR